MEKELWHKELRQRRLDYGVTQNKLAVATGISRIHLNRIETGKAIPKKSLKNLLDKVLEQYNPEVPLELLFDYVRIRFPTNKPTDVIEGILHLNMDYLLHEDFAYYSYTEHYKFGDIMIMTSHEVGKGVLLELKGKGCRQFEAFLLAQHRSWFDFFTDCIHAKGIFKRIDLAINDKVGLLNIPQLAQKCKEEECISVFRSFKNYRSGELVHKDEKSDMGNTLYIGSLKSEIYFCIYEKDYEQYVKQGISLEEALVKNRFEIRLKNERAALTIKELLKYRNPEKTAFGIINRYIRFVDKEISKRRSKWKINQQWAIFIGEHREAIRLTTEPEPYTFERTLNWLRHQVAPTLKVTTILDNILSTELLDEMIREAELTERHEKLIEQLSLTIDEVIL
ncbi:MobT family relaxase [Enterococcus faecalis]|uniref:MobT family relaxase n=1 Tax=Enterococcus faecalis TaxID=1351 RepID=UPI0013308B64|nr:MobT family relaxase [Enterococcus faecalis]EGO6578237.1 XRE family transcriptional regulator [Enterococcus faecalis]EGO7919004.1 XRE family transcriptional regulator [Enterococcus faecalis]EGO8225633.1 XRE family transcriptional regulator [Enterococcus faecalis]EGO8526574.1 XRE family transcriptional regulator [Enterococcus faecalis]EGO9234272.1 XRE family transcriptional regulator [Enterococcus faecalis]